MKLSPATLVHALADDRTPEELAAFQAELHRAGAVLAQLGLAGLAKNPRMTPSAVAQLAAVIAKGADLSAPIERTIALAMVHGLLPRFTTLVRAFDRVAQSHGVHRLIVTTAAELPAAKAEELRAALAVRSGGSLSVETQVDSTLLGGLRLQLDDQILDHSFTRALESLRA